MAYFELPTNYQCIVPNATDTQFYAYNSRTRDTFVLTGYEWRLNTHVSFNYDQDLSQYNCYTSEKLVPTSVLNSFVLPSCIIVLCFFALIIKMFMGVKR